MNYNDSAILNAPGSVECAVAGAAVALYTFLYAVVMTPIGGDLNPGDKTDN